MTDLEQWKKVPEYTGCEVSSSGKIRLTSENTDNRLYKYTNVKKHIVYIISKIGADGIWVKRKAFSLHGLVAELFIPKVDGFKDVKHLDFNENNNTVENLVWCDASDRDITYPIITHDIKEVWKSIKVNPSYMVSNKGRVKELLSGELVVLNKGIRNYVTVKLQNANGIMDTYRVNILVAEAFLIKAPGDVVVNHIDGLTDNNYVSNLEWCTFKHNSQHSVKTGLMRIGKDRPNAKLNDKQVIEICELIMNLKNKLADIGRKYGLNSAAIHSIYSGKNWKHISKDYNFPERPRWVKLQPEQVIEICEAIVKNPNINFTELGDNYDVSASVIFHIYNGTTWKSIGSNYTFQKRPSNVSLNEKEVREICVMIQFPDADLTEIATIYGVTNNAIYSIYSRRNWSHISKDFIFPERKKRTGSTDEDIHGICKLLQDTKLTNTEIAKKFDVKSQVVYTIVNGKNFKNISSQYDFSHRKSRQTDDEVRELAENFNKGLTDTEIAKKYKVARQTVNDIRNRRRRADATKDMVW